MREIGRLQRIFYQNSYIIIQENPFENVIWQIAAICLDLNVFHLFIIVQASNGTKLSFSYSQWFQIH